jgi:hypothetical protein
MFFFEDEIQKMSKKLQDAQTLNIHIVSEEFLNEIKTDRPSIIMEKCKISTWGILPHIRQQTKANEEAKIKSGRQSFTTASGKSDRNISKKIIHFQFSLFFSSIKQICSR